MSIDRIDSIAAANFETGLRADENLLHIRAALMESFPRLSQSFVERRALDYVASRDMSWPMQSQCTSVKVALVQAGDDGIAHDALLAKLRITPTSKRKVEKMLEDLRRAGFVRTWVDGNATTWWYMRGTLPALRPVAVDYKEARETADPAATLQTMAATYRAQVDEVPGHHRCADYHRRATQLLDTASWWTPGQAAD